MTDDRIPPPAHAAPWVNVLGEALAVEVFLSLGGSMIDLAYAPRTSALSEIVGIDQAAALGHALGAGKIKVPLAKPWVSQVLYRDGLAQQEIARRLHVDVATVARQLKATPGGRRRRLDTRQIELF
ncbi:hypothetical protein CXZ10_05930 [Pleomorphomonas diazotrophica]|uniref:Uncharacterized protein n=1 Tax=Pleomorphomonas diazotrophica TaxID=1166257 RepID=A0A1I4Q793_9HYPH|nr:helix-turn-helix domain-containing protein [Pleomorphomonas diazotrophica]PKR90883.1 hypothetical protein CXZ10_05930 [Pleomorphomonas diazotrophica]SFM35951.1 hypothetical protein SAMN05192571_101125 [Pleomorphomonas diazotrophica]